MTVRFLHYSSLLSDIALLPVSLEKKHIFIMVLYIIRRYSYNISNFIMEDCDVTKEKAF